MVKTDGCLLSCGRNVAGQLGDESRIDRWAPVQIARNVRFAAAGPEHGFFVKNDHTLWAFGNNTAGQLGNPDFPGGHIPTQVAEDIAFVATAERHSLFVKRDGSLWGVGENYSGQLGDGTDVNRSSPVMVASDVIDAAAGAKQSYFIKKDHTLWIMGATVYGPPGDVAGQQRLPVQIAADVVSLSASGSNGIFVKSDGTVWMMSHTFGAPRTPVLLGSGGFRSAVLGSTFVLAKKSDESLWSYGSGSWGELCVGASACYITPVVVAENVTSVSTSGRHSLFTKADGTLWATGQNSDGQIGDGTEETRYRPVQIATDAVKVRARRVHSLSLRNDASLWLSGGNVYHIFDPMGASSILRTTRIATDVVSFDLGSEIRDPVVAFVGLVKRDGSLWMGGANNRGQLGDGTTSDRSSLVRIDDGVVDVAIGDYHTLYLKTDGTVWGMGDWNGQLIAIRNQRSPVQIASGVRTIGAGDKRSFWITKNDELWATVMPPFTGSADDEVPRLVASGVRSAAVATDAVVFIKNDGTLWAHGFNSRGQFGTGDFEPVPELRWIASGVTDVAVAGWNLMFIQDPAYRRLPEIRVEPASKVVQVGTATSLEVTATGAGPFYYQWYCDGVIIPGARDASFAIADFQDTDAGRYHVDVRNSTGTVSSAEAVLAVSRAPGIKQFTSERIAFPGEEATFSIEPCGEHLTFQWECSYDGGYQWAALGDGTAFGGATTNTLTIFKASEDLAGAWVRCRIRNTDGEIASPPAALRIVEPLGPPATLWGVGNNDIGQLGTDDDTSVARVEIASDVVDMSAGRLHSLVLKRDGSLWATGDNIHGQIGDGSRSTRRALVHVADGVRKISAGGNHSLFTTSDGKLWTMGENGRGQLGDGTVVDRLSPVCVAEDVVSISAGLAHSLFIKSDGTLWGMGQNYYGQLGDGWNNDRHAPVFIADHVVAAGAGGDFSVFSRGDGSLWQMGNDYISRPITWGTPENYRPKQVMENVVGFAAGVAHLLVLDSKGTAWAFGSDAEGKLGPNFERPELPGPKIIEGVTSVAAGEWNSACVAQDGGLLTCGSNQYGQLGTGMWGGSLSKLSRVAENISTVSFGCYHTLVLERPKQAPVPTGRPINLSVRAAAGRGERTLVAGFVIEGPANSTKTVIVRVAGPALAAFGVTSFVADPSLVVYDGAGRVLESSENWDGALAPAFARVGAFAWAEGSNDAALQLQLHPGVYTAHAVNPEDDGAEALIEVYDASLDSETRLVNLSCRTFESVGALVIAGVVVDGPTDVLVRHSGPALGRFDIAETAEDVQLAFYRGGSVVARNDDWPWNLVSDFYRVGAFSWDGGSKDSAQRQQLSGGAFTIHCSVVGSSGVGLIELYRIP